MNDYWTICWRSGSYDHENFSVALHTVPLVFWFFSLSSRSVPWPIIMVFLSHLKIPCLPFSKLFFFSLHFSLSSCPFVVSSCFFSVSSCSCHVHHFTEVFLSLASRVQALRNEATRRLNWLTGDRNLWWTDSLSWRSALTESFTYEIQ